MSDNVNGYKKIATDGTSKKFLAFLGVAVIGVLGYVFLAPEQDYASDPSRLKKVPGGTTTVLGGEVNEVYEQALRDADRQRIEAAKKGGESAIPSIVGNKTEEQSAVELTVNDVTPDIVRPSLPSIEKIQKEEKVDTIQLPVVTPKELPKKEIQLPVAEAPKIQPKVTPLPAAAPAIQQAPVKPQVETKIVVEEPKVNPELKSAYSAQMAKIINNIERTPGAPQTQYFYVAPKEEISQDVSSSNVTLSESSGIVVGEDGSVQLLSQDNTITSSSDSDKNSPVKFPLAGQILYAELISRANSDAPGPIIAKIAQGELAGTTVIGSFQVANESLVLSFDRATVTTLMDGTEVNETFDIQAVAVDTKYIGTALATDVDRHLVERIAVTFGTSFLGGIGDMIANEGTTVVVNADGSTTTSYPERTLEEQARASAGSAVGDVGEILDEYYGSIPTTIIVESGTPIGLLFLN